MPSSRQDVEPGEPHVRDYWAGRRFTPQRVAPTTSGVWLAESLLPLLACVDPATGAVFGPLAIARPDGASREAQALAATDEAVWVRWNDGLTRFDRATQELRSLDVRGLGLAVGEEGVWVLPGDGRVARVEEEGAGLELLGDREERRNHIATGHGAVWTLAWTQASHPTGRSTLSRLCADTGQFEASLVLDGSPQELPC